LTGNHNVGIGYEALANSTTGEGNLALGHQAGRSNTTGSDNVFMVAATGWKNGNGNRNVYLGAGTGWINEAHGNVLIGNLAGSELTSGSKNVCIGELADWDFIDPADEYKLYIHIQDESEVNTPLLYGEFLNPDNGQEGKLAITYDRFPDAPDGNSYTLAVNGKTITEEVQILLEGDWPDYVFAEDYDLMTLTDLEAEIKTLGHLSGVPSAEEVEENGYALGSMDAILLEKIEELTLHMIEMNKDIERLEKIESQLLEENEALKNK